MFRLNLEVEIVAATYRALLRELGLKCPVTASHDGDLVIFWSGKSGGDDSKVANSKEEAAQIAKTLIEKHFGSG